MAEYYPDPKLLDALADVWDAKATDIDTLRNIGPGQIDGLHWSGVAQVAARSLILKVAQQLGNISELCRRFARKLRSMAKKIRDKLAEEAKNALILILVSILGLIAGGLLGAAIGDFIADLAAAIATALSGANEIATALLTLVFEFALGGLAFGLMQFALDMAIEYIASAVTNIPFSINGNEWQNVLIAALTGGLFSLKFEDLAALKNLPWKGNGAIAKPSATNPVSAHPTGGQGLGGEGLNTFDSNGVSVSSTGEFDVGAGMTSDLSKTNPTALSAVTADLGKGEANLGKTPKVAPVVELSASSSTHPTPVAGGSVGARNGVFDNAVHSGPPNSESVVPAKVSPVRQADNGTANPSTVTGSNKPPVNLERQTTPQTIENAPVQPGGGKAGPAVRPPATEHPVAANPQGGTGNPVNKATTPPNPHNETANPQAKTGPTVKLPAAPKVPAGAENAKPVNGAHSEPPPVATKPTANPAAGHPSAKFSTKPLEVVTDPPTLHPGDLAHPGGSRSSMPRARVPETLETAQANPHNDLAQGNHGPMPSDQPAAPHDQLADPSRPNVGGTNPAAKPSTANPEVVNPASKPPVANSDVVTKPEVVDPARKPSSSLTDPSRPVVSGSGDHQPPVEHASTPETAATSGPPGHTDGGSTGHPATLPGGQNAPHDPVPQTAVPKPPERGGENTVAPPDRAGAGSRDLRWESRQKPGLVAGLRDKITVALGIDAGHPDLDGDFAATLKSIDHGSAITKDQAAKLLSGFKGGASSKFGQMMDRAFQGDRPPTDGEKSALRNAYTKLVDGLRSDIQAQVAANKIDAAGVQLGKRFGDQHPDPHTGKPQPLVTRAVDAWTKDANGLVKQASKTGDWGRLDTRLKVHEGKFDGYLAAQRGAEAAGDRAVAHFHQILSKWSKPFGADVDRVTAMRGELRAAARDAYLALWGAKSLSGRGMPDAATLDKLAADWLLDHDTLIHDRLTYLERTQKALNFAEAKIRGSRWPDDPAQQAEINALLHEADALVDGGSGSFAANGRPQHWVIAAGNVRRFGQSAAGRTSFGTHSNDIFENALAKINSAARAGEAEAIGRGLDHIGSADRAVAEAQERLTKAVDNQLSRLENSAFKAAEVERSLNILQTRADTITGMVRRDTINDAVMQSAESEAHHMITAEVSGKGIQLGKGTFDRLAGEFTEETVAQYRKSFGATAGLRNEVIRWLGSRPANAETAGDRSLIDGLYPETAASSADVQPQPHPGQDPAGDSAAISEAKPAESAAAGLTPDQRSAAPQPARPVESVANSLSLEERFAALRGRPVESAASAPSLEEGSAAPRPVRPVESAVGDETPPVTPKPESAPSSTPETMRFNDPERQAARQQARQNLIDDLGVRLGNAPAINRIVSNLEADFARIWHATPGGSEFTEAQLVKQFEKFSGAATRSFNETLSPAFTEVRPATAAERGLWQRRYQDLLRDLGDDLRVQAGRNENDAAAGRAFDRWHEHDPDPVPVYNKALNHWTKDTEVLLDSIRATRTWDHAPGSFARKVAELDVYRDLHLGAQRAAARVGDRFDEIADGRPPLADSERRAQARAEAIDAAYDRYVRWWREARIKYAVDDLPGMVATADRRFQEYPDAIRTRLDYLDETQPILDQMAKMTRPDMLRKTPLLSELDEAQLDTVARMAQREAESLVDSRATPFVEDPPQVTESMLNVVQHAVDDLRGQIPARAAFAERAAGVTRAALDRIDAEAAAGAAEALGHGLDPGAALGRVSADARTAVFGLARDARERFAAEHYAEPELAGQLAALEKDVGAVVGEVRAGTVRDALLRRSDAEAVETLNQRAAAPGAKLGALVRERLYGDFEREFVRQDHVLFADGAEFDVAAWLSRTPPEVAAPRAIKDGADGRLITGHEHDPTKNLESLDALVLPGERAEAAAQRELSLSRLPEAERADWKQRFAAGADLSEVDRDLVARVLEVNMTRRANDTALAELVRGVRQAWAQAGADRVTPAVLGPLVRRFQDAVSDLGPRAGEPVGSLAEIPAGDLLDPVPPANATAPRSVADLVRQMPELPPGASKDFGEDFDRRLGTTFEGWFRDAAKPLPHKIQEKFLVEWLTVRADGDKMMAVRQRMIAAAATERAKLPIAQRHPELSPYAAAGFARRIEHADSFDDIARIEREAADAASAAAAKAAAAKAPAEQAAAGKAPAEKAPEALDDFNKKYEIVPEAERERFRRDIGEAATPRRLDEAYALLDARRDELAAAAAVKPKTFEEQIAILRRFVPRHGYRVIKDDTPIITAAQAARYNREFAQIGTLDDLAAFEQRLSEAGYMREPVDGDPAVVAAKVAVALPAIPMGSDDLVGMVRAWVADTARGSGLDKSARQTAVSAMVDAIAGGDGTALYEALDGFESSILKARLIELKRDPSTTKPATEVAKTTPEEAKTGQTPAVSGDVKPEEAPEDSKLATRLAALLDQDRESDGLRARLGDPSLQLPDTIQQAPVSPRSLEALRREMPGIPTTTPHEPWTVGDGGGLAHTSDPDGLDEEIRRMAEAEGRLGGPRAGTNPDADLMRRLRKLNESPAKPENTETKPAQTKPAQTKPEAAKKPEPGTQGAAVAEMIQTDGTVVLHQGEPALTGVAALRQQLAELDEIHAQTEAPYNSYLDLDKALRNDNEDLASRFAAKVAEWRTENPDLAAHLDEAAAARLQEGIARLVAKHFITVHETLLSAAEQRTMIAGLIAEKVEALGPELVAAARPKPPATTERSAATERSATTERSAATDAAAGWHGSDHQTRWWRGPATTGTRVDELTNERFDIAVGAFRRTDLFGGRYLGDADYALLHDSFIGEGRAAAGAPDVEAEWTPTAEWAATMDSATARLADELAVRSAGNRWFDRMTHAVAYDHDGGRDETPRPPQADWYREQFQQRLRADYARTFATVPPGPFAAGAAYLQGVAATAASATEKPEWTAWREALTTSLDWVRGELSFVYDMRTVLAAAAADFRRVTLGSGADAATITALAQLFRLEKVHTYLAGKGLPPETHDAWLAREEADTDVFGASLAELSAAQQEQPAEFMAKATRITDALITEYQPRVVAAAEVAQRKPDFAEQFAAAVTTAAEQTEEIRGQVGDDNLARFRTLDALAPADLIGWRDRVVADLTDLYHRVWNYTVQTGSAVDSEHWAAAAERWDELSTRYWNDLPTAALRQNQIGRLGPVVDKLRADAETAGLTQADTDAVVAAFTKDATAAIDRLLHTHPFDRGRLGRWTELESELLDSVPRYVRVAQARAAESARAAAAYRERIGDAGLATTERDARAAEVAAAAAEAFDQTYRQFRWAEEDQRLAQAEHAVARRSGSIVKDMAERPAAAEPVPQEEESASASRDPVKDLDKDARDRLGRLRRGVDRTDEAALDRIGAEIDSIVSVAAREYEAGSFAPALGRRAVAKARSRIDRILSDIPRRLADERRLADAIAAATGRFDALPGADQLGANDPLRYRFLNEVAGKAAAGNAGLTASARSAVVAAGARAAGHPASGPARTELVKPGHAPGGRLIPTADGVYLATGTDLGPPAAETAADGDFRVVAGPGSLELLMAYLQSAAGATSLAGVTVDLGLLTEDTPALQPIATLLPLLFGVGVDGVETGAAPGSPAAPPAQSPAATSTTTSGLATQLPSTLPPVELTPLATPPPAPAPAELHLDAGSLEADPEDMFRADLYDRLGSVPAPDPVDGFAGGIEGERAAVHWSLQTLAHHGEQWLNRGVAFLDEAEPVAREGLLLDAVRDAPTGTLLAFSRLIRGVSADPERDLPLSNALLAVHRALSGDSEAGAATIRATWWKAFPSRDLLVEALLARSSSAAERADLYGVGVALMICDESP